MMKVNNLSALPLLLLAIALFLSGPVAGKPPQGELRAPRDPSEPAVDNREKNGRTGEAEIPVTVTTAKGGALTGSLLLKFDTIEAEVMENGPDRKKVIPLASVASIEFTRWRGAPRRKNEYAFYPAQAKITLRDKKTYECLRIIPALNRLMFKNYKGSRFLYAYFFDYRDGKTWKNSGETDLTYPETNPPAGTLVRIDFTAAEMKNPLEMLFRQLVPAAR